MRQRRPFGWGALSAAGLAAALIAGCAAGPRDDGGIVGTGNRPDCDEQLKKDGTGAPVLQECKRDR